MQPADLGIFDRQEGRVEVDASPEELAELEAGIAEADRGDLISGEELFRQLRRHG